MTSQFPPGPKGLKVLRQLRDGTPQRLITMQDLSQTYGDITHMSVLGKHYYLLNRPELIHYVLVEGAEQFHSLPIGKRMTNRSLDPMVVKADRAFHRQQRRLLQPAFTPKGVAKYADVMVKYANDLINRWQPGETRDIAEDMMQLTLCIVGQTLFNVDISDKSDVFSDAVRRGSAYLASGDHAPIWVLTANNRKLIRSWLRMDQAIKRVISERRASGIDQGDLLSTILLAVDDEGGGQLTDKQAHSTVMGMFIAGHETTSNAMTWTWYLLARHPDVAAALRAELDQVLAGRPPTAADLDQLPYTGWVIRETMRLYPPAWVVTRFAIEPTTLDGYTIPKGGTLFMSPYVMQRDGRYFEQPEQFAPERWAGDFEKRLPSFAYFPFGGGAHVCLGQFFAMLEARLLLAAIAQRCQFTLLPDQPINMQPLITLRPDGPIRMRVQARA